MRAGKAYLEHNNQVAGLAYKNVSVEYELEVSGSKRTTSHKASETS